MKVTADMVETANLKMAQPGIRLAPSYAGWLRRFAFKLDDIKAAVVRNAATVIEEQHAEIYRLREALEAAAGVREGGNVR